MATSIPSPRPLRCSLHLAVTWHSMSSNSWFLPPPPKISGTVYRVVSVLYLFPHVVGSFCTSSHPTHYPGNMHLIFSLLFTYHSINWELVTLYAVGYHRIPRLSEFLTEVPEMVVPEWVPPCTKVLQISDEGTRGGCAQASTIAHHRVSSGTDRRFCQCCQRWYF